MKKLYIIFLSVVLALLSGAGIYTVMAGNREYSENENRYLTKFAPATLTGFLNGEVQENLTDAMNDQYIGRDTWTGLSTFVEKALGYQDIGGVYLGKDHYYFEKTMNQDISQTNYFQNLRFIQYLEKAQSKARVTTMLVPSPGTVLSDKLPEHAVLYDADNMFREAALILGEKSFLDIRRPMKVMSERNQVYFRTDHHWNLRGAHLAYQLYSNHMKRKSDPFDSFQIKAVSDSFYGTLYSKVLDEGAVPDELDSVENLPITSIICDGKERDSIYESGKLAQKDKYAYFFGGNYGKVIIQPNSASEKKLLVFKDSFANTMIPFLMADYQEIIMLDMRYYKESVAGLLSEYKPDEILILYEMSNFAQDKKLHNLTK